MPAQRVVMDTIQLRSIAGVWSKSLEQNSEDIKNPRLIAVKVVRLLKLKIGEYSGWRIPVHTSLLHWPRKPEQYSCVFKFSG